VAVTVTAPAPSRRRTVTRFFRLMRRNPAGMLAGFLVIAYAVIGLLAPWISPSDPNATNLMARLSPPSAEHWFGTDALGRDILSRTIHGARISIMIGLATVAISTVVGVTLGTVAGYYGGAFDRWVSRATELLLAFPYLIFAIGMMAFLGPGFWNLIWALSFKGWVEFFRLSRGETLQQRAREYVEAAKALGQRSGRTIVREILPNIVPAVLVVATLRVGFFIVLEASLSFLGVGIPPALPAWGSMISEGRDVLFIAWWVSTIPGVVLLVLVLSINLLGEALREVLDPRLSAGT
jgi:ABC-type dipeptide/oligopeptide/nickel transport system permease subunit